MAVPILHQTFFLLFTHVPISHLNSIAAEKGLFNIWERFSACSCLSEVSGSFVRCTASLSFCKSIWHILWDASWWEDLSHHQLLLISDNPIALSQPHGVGLCLCVREEYLQLILINQLLESHAICMFVCLQNYAKQCCDAVKLKCTHCAGQQHCHWKHNEYSQLYDITNVIKSTMSTVKLYGITNLVDSTMSIVKLYGITNVIESTMGTVNCMASQMWLTASTISTVNFMASQMSLTAQRVQPSFMIS